jgi:hypothetical protein
VNTAFCPCGVRSPGVCLASATQVLDHVPSSPVESHCISPPQLPSWTRPGTPLSYRPAAADVPTPPAGHNMRRILPTLGDPTCTGIFHTSAKDSRTSPRTGRQDQSARVPPRSRHLSADRPDFPRRRKRPEDTAGTWRTASHTGPSRQRSASKAHDCDRPAGYPGATCHPPPREPQRHQMQASPNDHAGHPILHESALVR